MLDTILVPLDGSTLAERALPYATALARARDAKLVLLRALPARAPGSAMDEKEAVQAELDAVAERVRADGLTVEAIVRRVYLADVAIAITAVADERGANLIVMSTHGRSGLGRWIYGSVADSVLRHSEVPVLLVPPHDARAWPTDRPLRVLVPLDGSDLAEEALRTAERLAETVGAELVLLRVVELPTYPLYGDGYAYVPVDADAQLAEAERYLSEQIDRLQAGGKKATMRALIGQPSGTIAEVARDGGIDLVVMATHGRGGLARMMLGSVATGTLQRAAMPVLLVRPTAASQPAPEASGTPERTVGDAEAARPLAGPPSVATIGVQLTMPELEMVERGLRALTYLPGYDYAEAAAARALLHRLEAAAHAETVCPA